MRGSTVTATVGGHEGDTITGSNCSECTCGMIIIPNNPCTYILYICIIPSSMDPVPLELVWWS